MAIKYSIITIDDYKNSGFYDPNANLNTDTEIEISIRRASTNIHYHTSRRSLDWINATVKPPNYDEVVERLQEACYHTVRFLLTTNADYIRGAQSFSQGTYSISQSAPDEPFYLPNETIQILKEIDFYSDLKFYNLNLEPTTSSSMYGNIGDGSLPLTVDEADGRYLIKQPGSNFGLTSIDNSVKITSLPDLNKTIDLSAPTNPNSFDDKSIKPNSQNKLYALALWDEASNTYYSSLNIKANTDKNTTQDTAIQKNITDISKNTTDIANNKTDIATKYQKVKVYSTTSTTSQVFNSFDVNLDPNLKLNENALSATVILKGINIANFNNGSDIVLNIPLMDMFNNTLLHQAPITIKTQTSTGGPLGDTLQIFIMDCVANLSNNSFTFGSNFAINISNNQSITLTSQVIPSGATVDILYLSNT